MIALCGQRAALAKAQRCALAKPLSGPDEDTRASQTDQLRQFVPTFGRIPSETSLLPCEMHAKPDIHAR